MNWITSMLQDGSNASVSSKRVVTLAAFILCAVAFIANLFYNLKIEQFIFETMAYIAMVGLGTTVAEKFSPKSNNQPQQYQYPEPRPMVYSRRTATRIPQNEDQLL